jgi:RNA polymerase sigma-70 factor (ECF subfamily)
LPIDSPIHPEVLGAARRGDREALELLLTSHYDQVHALCRRMLGNEADALDATQDALLAAVRAIGRFDGRSSFGTWLYRIATNACIDELRRRRRRPLVGLPSEDGDHRSGGTSSGPMRRSPGASVGDPAEEASTKIDVDGALAGLTTDFRTAVVLRDVCDLTYDEIADILEVPIGTVRSRIARGRAALADALSPDSAVLPVSAVSAVSDLSVVSHSGPPRRNRGPRPDVETPGER